MMLIKPRETTVLAEDFEALVTWYVDVLGLTIMKRFDEDYHYCNLENDAGIRIGIGSAAEMGVTPGNRANSTVIIGLEVEDVPGCFERIAASGGAVLNGPTQDKTHGFWFGNFADPEGNVFWVVDENCP